VHRSRESFFAAHYLFGTTANWWETYCNTHADVDSITWNRFKARFRNHYVPHGTMKLKKKEFTDLKQGSMMMNEYPNSFIQLSRYATEDINIDEKKHDTFLEELNDDIQFQLLNTDYADFQHMVDKTIVIENKLKEMEKDGKRKMSFHGQSFGSNVRLRFSQPNQFFKPPQMNRPQMPMQMQHPQFQMQWQQYQM
jgi:paraquat-inducible protein B